MRTQMVIRMSSISEKGRSKAMKIAAETHGVESVTLAGKDRSLLVVVGDGLDSNALTTKLRRKVGRADLVELHTLQGGIGAAGIVGGGSIVGGGGKGGYYYAPSSRATTVDYGGSNSIVNNSYGYPTAATAAVSSYVPAPAEYDEYSYQRRPSSYGGYYSYNAPPPPAAYTTPTVVHHEYYPAADDHQNGCCIM